MEKVNFNQIQALVVLESPDIHKFLFSTHLVLSFNGMFKILTWYHKKVQLNLFKEKSEICNILAQNIIVRKRKRHQSNFPDDKSAKTKLFLTDVF